MTYDLIIRAGLIVDGTGAKPFIGDVAIDGDTIVAMGTVDGEGTREADRNFKGPFYTLAHVMTG